MTMARRHTNPEIRYNEWIPAEEVCFHQNGAVSIRNPAAVTDRALRYRANSTPPAGKKICCFCGARRDIQVGHVDGHEERNTTENLVWTCRRCNALSAITMQRAGIGRLTHQYNPGAAQGATSLGQWTLAVQSMKGESDVMSVRDAVAMIKATPQSRRSEFAHEIWRRRRERHTDTWGVPF